MAPLDFPCLATRLLPEEKYLSVGTALGALNVAREFFTRSAVVGLWAATALAQASIQFTPHPDTVSAPYYFSGTNSRASFYAHVVYPTLHIARALLRHR